MGYSDTVYFTLRIDTDGDGVGDTADDDDGVLDFDDAFPLDPAESVDVDGDGVGNNADADDDNDEMPDTWETEKGLNPTDSTDASLDIDGDGLTNLQEYQGGTDPNVPDVQEGSVEGVPLRVLGVVVTTVIAATMLVLWRRRSTKSRTQDPSLPT